MCAHERSIHCPLAQRKAREGREAGRGVSGEGGFPVNCVPLSFGDSTSVFFHELFFIICKKKFFLSCFRWNSRLILPTTNFQNTLNTPDSGKVVLTYFFKIFIQSQE